MKKHFWIISLIMMLVTIALSSEPRTVTLWSFAANNMEEWQARKAEIEKKFGINLKLELIAQNAFVQKLQAVMMDGKGAPDIIEWLVEDNRVCNADPKKALVLPLDKYVAKSEVFKNVVPGRVAWTKYGGHTYGMPHDVHPCVLIYNDTLWKSVGVDVATLETWDDFFTAAQKLTAEKKDGKPVHYAIPETGNLGATMFMIWQQAGANIVDKDGKPTFETPEFKEFVSKYLGWYKTGSIVSWDWGNFPALLKNGTLAAYASPDWWVGQVNDAAKDGKYQFRVRPLPTYKKGGPQTASWGGSFFAIPKGTKNPDQLYPILEYMQYDPGAAKARYKTGGMLPPLASVWNDDVFKQPDPRFGGQKLGELQTAMAKQMPSMITGDLIWTYINNFGTQYSEITTGKLTVDQGLKLAQENSMKAYEASKK